MARKLAAVMILLLALALGAGCAAPGSSGGGQATPAQGGTQGSGGAFSPGPVVTVPPGFEVEYQVNKNMISTNPTIDVFYRGGKGQLFLQKLLVEVQKSDGSIQSGELVRVGTEQIKVGDKVTIRGTTGTDRVVITVTLVNKDYKIHDQLYEFKTRQ